MNRIDISERELKRMGWVKLSALEREHILETQESLCELGKTAGGLRRPAGDDGSCSICQSIKKALGK